MTGKTIITHSRTTRGTMRKGHRTLLCFQALRDPRFFAVYSFMVISIEKEIKEINLDIDSIIILFFSLKYDLSH